MIGAPYLLVSNIECVYSGNNYWFDPMWHKDLMLHLDVISDLRLFCPVKCSAPPAGWIPLGTDRLAVVRTYPMSRRSIFLILLILLKLDRAMRDADIVHTGVAGWPFPIGWLAAPLARLRGKKLIIIVESSFWRTPTSVSIIRKLRSSLFEFLNRACVNTADISFFTTSEYRNSLATNPRGIAVVMQAIWVDEFHILSEHSARKIWASKKRRLLFAGRLDPEKGIRTLLAALERSQACVDILGDGPCYQECITFASRHPGRVQILPPVPYGDAFFRLIDQYQAILVPTLSDEQPRIIFDAYARAIPVIASNTPGNSESVSHRKTGILVTSGDAIEWAKALDSALGDKGLLQSMGLQALRSISGRTHHAMHRERAKAILSAIPSAVRQNS